ncbi:MAG: beta-propeller fold lactonase family protein [Acidobacteria bacterium]|nr:beta-propeller fold lactonase family protein [Acidobacteriota bacterium]
MRSSVVMTALFTAFFGFALAGLKGSDNTGCLKRSSSAIAITADGATLLVVNRDSNSLTLVDTATRRKVAEIRVGVDPRAVAVDDARSRAYVANQGSDSVSVVDLTARQLIDEVAVGDSPVGVAVSPDGRVVAVAELGDDTVRLLHAADLSTLAVIVVADRPYGLSFTLAGRHLLITHLLSGQVSVISLNREPAFRSSFVSFVTQISTWPNVAPAPTIVVNAAGTRAYLPQTVAHALGLNIQFDNTVFPRVSVLDLETNGHQPSEDISLPEKDQPVGLPWDVTLARNDTELWVVNAASNDVSVLDISNPAQVKRVAHIPVADNPRGIVVSPDGTRVYVNNTLAGTLSVIDANTYSVTEDITVTDIPLPPVLLNGKRLFHSSARGDLAQGRWISCNTCHVEAEHDGRTWLLQYVGELPPGATPVIKRNTTSLLGMIETYPLRWSAEWDESADSEFSIRFEQFGAGLIHDEEMNATLGEPNQGRAYDLDCLATYIDSLAVPFRKHTLTLAERRGKMIFESPETKCAECHPAPLYTDLQVHDVGTANAEGEWLGPHIDTPTLRFLYDSAPYLHDGSTATLRDVWMTANPEDKHGITSHLTEQETEDLIAFLLALPYE